MEYVGRIVMAVAVCEFDEGLYISWVPAREELRKNIDDFLKKVTGKMDASVKKVNAKVNDSLN